MLSSFASHVSGELNGNASLSGTIAHPMIVGDAFVENGKLGIAITGVTYHTSDSLLFDNNTVHLRDFTIEDDLGNQALANGTLRLDNDGQLKMDLNVKTDNLMVLDQKSGEQFYGRLFASADGQVTGPLNHLNIDVRARTNPGCELTVPISYQQSVKSQNYISFVNDEPTTDDGEEEKGQRSDFDLDLALSITPDVKLNLPMDFKEVGVTVGATGAGDLHLSLNGTNSPQVIGSYEITSGQMKVGLFSVYEKRFTIESGSSLIGTTAAGRTGVRIETLIARNAAQQPDRTFVVAGNARLSHGDIDRFSSRLAAGLSNEGVRPGDRIVFILDNGSEAVVSFFSAWKLGAVACRGSSYVTFYFMYRIRFLVRFLYDPGR
jgi:hypothetical protein